MPEVFLQEDLKQIEKELWTLLEKGVPSYKASFHHACLATIHEHQPQIRTVVLRHVEKEKRELFFHTDIRSSKITAIKSNPHISLLFYDPDLRIQIRCTGLAFIHHQNEITELAWEKSRLSSKLYYTNKFSPGEGLTELALIDLNRTEVTDEELKYAYSQFSVVISKIEKIDWLFLHHTGHRRAEFDYLLNNFQWKQA